MQKRAPQDRAQYAHSAYHIAETASKASEVLGTDWLPSPEQQAKLCYRIAMTHRLADDDKRVALLSINLAAEANPDGEAIQKEKEAIRRWVSGR